jgi:hypothetical protein
MALRIEKASLRLTLAVLYSKSRYTYRNHVRSRDAKTWAMVDFDLRLLARAVCVV